MIRSALPTLVAIVSALMLPSLVACGPEKSGNSGSNGDSGQDDGGSQSLQPACEAYCRHLLECWGEDDPAELSQCTSDICEGEEDSPCESETRAFLECVTDVSCDLIDSEADFCEVEEATWDECDEENAVGSSSGDSGTVDSTSTGPGYEVWGCSFERKTRLACPGVNDPGEWSPSCSDLYAVDEADAWAQCDEMTAGDTSCDETGCCYETRFQAVELIPGGC